MVTNLGGELLTLHNILQSLKRTVLYYMNQLVCLFLYVKCFVLKREVGFL